jgi:hypothetical protein
LGCVLFECLTGEPPYPREQEVAAMYAHLREPVPRPTQRRPDLPHAIDSVVARAMAKDPEDRFGSGSELSATLGGALGTVPGPATTAGGRGRRRNIDIGVGIVAIVAVVVAVLVIPRGGDDGGNTAVDRPRSITIPVDGVVRLDPRTLRRWQRPRSACGPM